jgi:NADPH:quinone reductase-like Zn-dependent oxidoreductase
MSALFFGPAPVSAGMTVLTQGTGGVSCFAIQLAAAAGATVIATSSSKEKLRLAKQLGATHLINYSITPDWSTRVLELTNGHGVDHVVDVAGAGTIEQSLKATRQGGFVSVIGNLSTNQKVDIVEPLFFGAKSMRGIFGADKEVIDALMRFVDEKGISPLWGKSSNGRMRDWPSNCWAGERWRARLL